MTVVSKLALPLAIAAALPICARAATIPFDTSTASDWSVTAGGAQNAAPYVVPVNFYAPNGSYVGNVISITSTCNDSGAFLPGGSLANFDGYWTAAFTFYLPANAANVQLNYADFFADDRAVLTLNGTIFDSTGLTPDLAQNNGAMVLTDGGPAQPWVFSQPWGQVSGTLTSGFNLGGYNTLKAILNNTGDGIAATMNGHLAWNDGTDLGLTGSITYTVVPEPSLAALAFLGAGLVLRFQRARSACQS
ncbi:MAG TPA: hypothetical protein VMB80_11930 [Candidatus Acidoferrum sp.]|nr:hypothetical protein [Candidatus Acidoferrum sp.]